MKLVTPISSLFLTMMTMDITMDTGAMVRETMDIEAVEDIAMDIEAMGEMDTINNGYIYCLYIPHSYHPCYKYNKIYLIEEIKINCTSVITFTFFTINLVWRRSIKIY